MFWLIIFIISCFVLFWSGSRLVKNLMDIARYLGWREFVVAFFIMAFAASAPNFFIGLNAAFQGIPQLSFGEIVGGSMIDLTLSVGLAVLIGGSALQVKSKMVQTSSIFTTAIALLPLILIFDGDLKRIDGIILLLSFAIYAFWLFSKEERFRKVYRANKYKPDKSSKSFIDFLKSKKEHTPFRGFKVFIRNLIEVVFFLGLLLLASWGIVKGAQSFANILGLTLPMVGILIVGLGSALPETYFAIISSRKHQTWMILGDLMGSVIVCSALVLGIVVLIQPIENLDISPFVIARAFLAIAALFFFIAIRTDRCITKKEALFLLFIYIAFFVAEIIFR